MTIFILLSILNSISLAVSCACFLRIRSDYDYLVREKSRGIDLLDRFMDQTVTRDEMREFMLKIEKGFLAAHEVREKMSEEKWTQWKNAFGKKDEAERV